MLRSIPCRAFNSAMSTIKSAKARRLLLLPLVSVAVLAGLLFSGSPVTVHSKGGSPAVAPSNTRGAATVNTAGGDQRVAAKLSPWAQLRPNGDSGLSVKVDGRTYAHARVAGRVMPILLLVGSPVIEAAMADTLTGTVNNGDGKADPGDTITYTVTLKNTGTADANSVIFSDTIDSHTTYVASSLNASALAVDDTYTATGNVSITQTAPALLANDFDPDNGTNTSFTATAETKKSTNCASCAVNNVTINANGSFTYDPPPGFTGADTFTYTTNSPDGTTGTGTVTVTVSNMIWFIDANASTDGDGRLDRPFKFLASFQAINDGVGTHAKANDNIFLYESATNYAAPLTLLSGQKVIGQDSSASISTLTGITPPSGSASLPTTNSGNGVFVNITSAAGGILLNSGNLLRGFNLTGITGTALQGTNFGTLSLTEVNVSSNAQALSLTTGTVSGPNSSTAQFGTLTAGGGTNGILLSGVGGTLTATGGSLTGTATGPTFSIVGGSVTVTYPGTITQANNNAAVSVSGTHTGTLTLGGNISATNGTGLQFNDADGTYTFTGTTITLGGGDAGIDITNGSGGNFTFPSGTAITNPTNAAFLVNGGGGTVTYNGTISKNNAGRAVDIQSRTGGSVSLTGSISSTGTSTGILAQNNTGGTISFSNATKTLNTGASNAVTLTTNNGATINFTNGLDIDTTSGIGFQATGGGIININTGTNTVNSTSGQAIDIDACQTNITFNTVDSSGSGAQGIDLTNLSANSVFTVSGTTTINNTTGVSINVNTTGASTDLNFATTNITNRKATGIQIASAQGTIDFGSTTIANPNNAGGFGIRVDTSSAVITVSTASISFTNQTLAETDVDANNIPESDGDGDAIFLKDNTNSAFRFNLNGGTLTDLDDDGVDIRNSGGVNLTGVTITKPNRVGNSNAPGHHGFYATELRGANNSITNCIISAVPSGGGGVRIMNVLQNSTFTATNCKFRDSTTGDSFFVVQTGGGTTNTVNITGDAGTENSLFTNLDGQAVQTDPGFSAGSTTLNTNISNTTFKIAAATATGNNGIVIGSSSFPGVNNINISSNTLDDVERGTALAGALHVQGNNGSITGTISGNTIKNIPGQRGIHIVSEPPDTQANGTGLGFIDINIDNNNIYGLPDHEAIFADLRTRTGDSELKITNNCIGKIKVGGSCTGATSNVGGTREAIEIRSRTSTIATGALTSPRSFKLEISNNSITADTSLDQVVDIDAEEQSNTFITYLNNTLSNPNSGGTPSNVTTVNSEAASSTVCLDIRTNSSSHTAGGIVDYALTQSAGTFQVEGAGAGAVSAAAIQAQNTSGTASVSGTINFNNNTNCAQPVGALVPIELPQQDRSIQLTATLQTIEDLMDSVRQGLNATRSDDMISRKLTTMFGGDAAHSSPESIFSALTKQSARDNSAYAEASKSEFLGNSESAAAVASNEDAAGNASDGGASKLTAEDRKEMMASHGVSKMSAPASLAAAPMPSGETLTVNGSGSGFTLPQGKQITITFQVTLNNPPNLSGVPPATPQVSNQGSVSGSNFTSPVLTHDPDPASAGGASPATKDPTLTGVDLFDSTTTVITSGSPSNQGDSVTFTATVVSNPSGNPTAVSGNVTFLDGATPLTCSEGGAGGVRPISGGTATCTTTAITPAGSPHTINAQYSGDGNYDPSSGSVQQTVIACTTNPVVTSTADSGAGTLRDALGSVCSAPNNNITFNLGAGAHTITPLSTLVIGRNANITNTLSGTNGALTINVNGGNFRAFRVDSPVTTATLSGFTVTGVNATAINGGGLLVQNGTVTLNGMLFTGNTVINGDGGGVAAATGTTVNVYNSTISGNTARHGGGLFSSGGTFNLVNVTVTNNNANGNTGTGACPAGGSVNGAGGAMETGGNTTNIRNSILTGNTACNTGALNISGAFMDQGNTFVSGDPKIAALADNGGLTRTHALLSDSPALDAGDNAAASAAGLTTDQRGTGFARKLDAADADTTQTVDIGAFEADPSVENISNKTTAEDTPLEFIFNVGDSTTAFTSITASSSNTTLVPNASAVVSADTASTRKLTLTPAANQVGTTTITVTVTKTISGTSVSMSDTFDLTVTEVNDTPTANADTLSAVNEDSGTRLIPFTDLTGNDSRGGGTDENGQTLTITAVNNPVGGTVNINGTNVEFTPTANFAGTASFEYTVTDNGTTNTASDPKNATGTASFTVTAINDEPSFTKGADQTVAEDSGAQTVNGWATSISRGGGTDENAQTLTFNVTNNTNTGLFSVQPAVSDTGVLTYTPAANAFGTAAITLELKDNGGTTGGGDDTSPTQTFNITVTAVADTPSVTNATTTVNVQTTSGLVITEALVDSGSVTHFKITNIQNGTLFQNNGTTPINDGDFITAAEGGAGLKFTPTTDSSATGSFDIQASTSGADAGLGGAVVTATITVSKNASTTDVTSSGSPSYDNQTVTFTAEVKSGTSVTTVPTGTVDFKANGNPIAGCSNVALDGTGKAQCQTNALTSAGSPYSITADYSGDSVYDISSSSGLLQIVNPSIAVIVNTTGDQADANPGDGLCDVDTGTAGQQCTLRAAIEETNAIPSDDSIDFTIPNTDPGYDSGSGRYTITLSTALPAINGSVVMTGLTADTLTVERSNAGGTPDFRIFLINAGKTVVITGMTVTNGNVVSDSGGGIANQGTLKLDDVVVTNNNATGSGGGIQNSGTLTIGESTISGNDAQQGGGIYSSGGLSLTESTISGNTSLAGGGGAVLFGTSTITNSTFSGNSAKIDGGGINAAAPGTLTMVNVTVTNNFADSDNNGAGVGGGIVQSGGPTSVIILHNTIVAGNFNENGAVDAADDVNGALDATSLNNLIGVDTGMTGISNGSNGNQVGTLASPLDARLGPLTNNGGLTLTHALLPGSPALDAGSDTAANNASLVTDQRCSVHNRFVDSDDSGTTPTVDIGAFEAQVAVQDIADQSTNEDTQLVVNFNVSDGVAFGDISVSSSNTTLVPNANIAVTGASSPLTLTIDPAAGLSGTTTITVTATLSGFTMTDTFVLTVNAVADTPTVGNATTLEDTQSGAISVAKNANDGAEVTHFKVTGITNGKLFLNDGTTEITNGTFVLFSAVGGGLKFTPSSNLNSPGSSFGFTIQAATGNLDATLGGGTATSTITVTAVNDAPSFTKGADQTVNEDAGAQTVNPWATAISTGPADESGQTVTFTVTNDNNSLFSSQPAVSPAGVLTYTPAANQSGSATVSVSVKDNGLTANGGQDTSGVQTFTITVNAVNDVPSFTKGADQTVLANSGAQTVNPWATNISAGPSNESSQVVDFIVSNNNNSLFSTQPAVSATGVLTYTPATNQSGSATVSVQIHDNGGTANGGQNTSAIQTFTITVNKSGTTTGLTSSLNPAFLSQNVTFTATVTSSTAVTGPPTGSVDFKDGATTIGTGTLNGSGVATFSTNSLSPAGSPHSITAVYNGDGAYNGSTSNSVSQVIKPALALVVNTTGDQADATLDGFCDVDTVTAGDQCTLRAAIQETNNLPSDDTISFSLPSGSTITLLTALPSINGNVQITGPGADKLTVQRSTAGGTPDFRIFSVNSGKTITISGMTVTNGRATGGGGGILNQGTLTLNDVVVTGNTSINSSGGGIFNSGASAQLTIGKSTISGNTGNGNAGGIFNNNGTLNLTESTISGNTATGDGGGISNTGPLNLTNVTISGNTAGGDGGGIQVATNNLNAVNVTVTANSADSDNNNSGVGGGIFVETTATALIHNTIVAGNFNENGAVDAADDVKGALNNLGANNLIGVGNNMTGLTHNSNGNLVGTTVAPFNPFFAPLANYGGTTQTHALLPGSPAINAGNTGTAPAADQRGISRVGTADIGAFESRGFSIATTSGTPQSTPILTAFGAPLVSTVTSAFGEPVSGGFVTYFAPASGASATFTGGVTTFLAAINGSGQANPTPTANGTAGGPYNVTAQANGVTGTATFSLTNQKGSQTITFGAIPTKTFGNADFNVTATSSSGLPVAFQASGQCTVAGNTVHITAAGSCTITASQGGDSNYNAATPVPQTFTIDKAATTTAISSNSNPSDFSESVTFTATVTSTTGATATGTVTFKDGATTLGTGTLNGSGVATFSTSTLSVGAHTITAVYGGDSNFLTSTSSTLTQTVKPVPTLSINDVSVTEGNSGTVSAIFTVTLSAASNLTVSANYATADGTATTANNDYLNAAGNVTFTPGQTQKTITVFVNGDTVAEPDENYFVNISGATNATISDNQGLGTILSDDTPVGQFSSSTYTVNENALRVTITVNRLGDLSKAASVEYATSDTAGLTPCSVPGGTVGDKASERCDYATSVGILRFAAGQSSKVINIPIVNDIYVDGTETFRVTLRNPVEMELGSPAVATVTITDDDVAGVAQPHPLVSNEFFIRQLYIDFLGREADPPGLAAWLQILAGNAPQCKLPTDCDRIAVAAGFVASPEFRDRGYFVYKLYSSVLGRVPHYAELIPDMAKLNGFLSDAELEANKTAFVAEFISRTEFQQKYAGLNNAAFVSALVQAGGLPNHPGRVAWTNALNAGTLTRAQVVRQYIESTEVSQKFVNEAVIVMNYFGFLRRDADAAYQVWIETFNHSNDYRLVINGFMNSSEYGLRFGP